MLRCFGRLVVGSPAARQSRAVRVSAGHCRKACRGPDLRESGSSASIPDVARMLACGPDLRESGYSASIPDVAEMLASGGSPRRCAVQDEQDLGLGVPGDGVEDAGAQVVDEQVVFAVRVGA